MLPSHTDVSLPSSLSESNGKEPHRSTPPQDKAPDSLGKCGTLEGFTARLPPETQQPLSMSTVCPILAEATAEAQNGKGGAPSMRRNLPQVALPYCRLLIMSSLGGGGCKTGGESFQLHKAEVCSQTKLSFFLVYRSITKSIRFIYTLCVCVYIYIHTYTNIPG